MTSTCPVFKWHLNTRPFCIQPLFHHLNHELVRYSDPYCICLAEFQFYVQLHQSKGTKFVWDWNWRGTWSCRWGRSWIVSPGSIITVRLVTSIIFRKRGLTRKNMGKRGVTWRSRHNAVTRSLRSAEVHDVLEKIIGDKSKADFMTVSPSMYASPWTPMITSSDRRIFYIKKDT